MKSKYNWIKNRMSQKRVLIILVKVRIRDETYINHIFRYIIKKILNKT